jgi:hypothetical protein
VRRSLKWDEKRIATVSHLRREIVAVPVVRFLLQEQVSDVLRRSHALGPDIESVLVFERID